MGAHIRICIATYVYHLFVLAIDATDAYNKVKTAFINNDVNGFELNSVPNGNLKTNFSLYRICIANGNEFGFIVVNSIDDSSVNGTMNAIKAKLHSCDLEQKPDYSVELTSA